MSSRKSTGEHVWMYNAAVIARSSKFQSVLAASSAEEEYMTQSKSEHEALGIRKLVHGFVVMRICADNQGAIAIAKDWKVNTPTKHISPAYHLKRDYVNEKMLTVKFVSSESMLLME